jgi:hypothetical protein
MIAERVTAAVFGLALLVIFCRLLIGWALS